MATRQTTSRIPSFQTPGSLDLRAFQQALDNIREGMRTLESRVGAVTQQAGQSTFVQGQSTSLDGVLLAQVTALQKQVDSLGKAGTGTAAVAPSLATLFGEDGQDGDDGMPAAVGPVATGSDFQRINFSYGDASPALIGTIRAGMRVVEIELAVDVAFNGVGAALTIGTLVNPSELMGAEVDAGATATFTNAPQVTYATATLIYLFITPGSGATAGAGALLVQSS